MYVIEWTSRYGKEIVDKYETREEAERMVPEYRMAYGEGSFRVFFDIHAGMDR